MGQPSPGSGRHPEAPAARVTAPQRKTGLQSTVGRSSSAASISHLAVSSLKCNGLWRGLIVDDQLAEDFVRGEEVEDFSRSVVEALGISVTVHSIDDP